MNSILTCIINFYLPVVDGANPANGGTCIRDTSERNVGPGTGAGRRIASELGEWGCWGCIEGWSRFVGTSVSQERGDPSAPDWWRHPHARLLLDLHTAQHSRTFRPVSASTTITCILTAPFTVQHPGIDPIQDVKHTHKRPLWDPCPKKARMTPWASSLRGSHHSILSPCGLRWMTWCLRRQILSQSRTCGSTKTRFHISYGLGSSCRLNRPSEEC